MFVCVFHFLYGLAFCLSSRASPTDLHRNHLGIVTMQSPSQQVPGTARQSAFPTRSHVMPMLRLRRPHLGEQGSGWANLVKFTSDFNKAGVQEAEPTEDQARRHLRHRLSGGLHLSYTTSLARGTCSSGPVRASQATCPTMAPSDKDPCLS